ncbi:MAG: Na+/H+ antiporter subunit E [Candidatus Izimaplasma sp.]|nr:Na+/H+ antiporter subunit E [Candidatus Izimaplasma bacterium]
MKHIATFLVLFVIYGLLTNFVIDELLIGALVSLVLTIFIAKYTNYSIDYKLPIRLAVFLFAYLPVFFGQLVLANLDVAKRVLSPKIPLNPGFIKVKTDLKGDFAKLTLANSITLTPGTLSVDIDGDYLYIHTIDVKENDPAKFRQQFTQLFEKILGVVFND